MYTQGFHLRLEARRFIRLFSIPCPLIWFQYLRDFLLFHYYNLFLLKQLMNLPTWGWQNTAIKFFKTATLLFFFAYRVEYFISFPFHFNEIEVTISFSFLLSQVEREIPRWNTLHALVKKKKCAKEFCRTFVTEYHPSVTNLKNVVMSKWHLIENQPLLREIYTERPSPSFIQKKQVFRNCTR